MDWPIENQLGPLGITTRRSRAIYSLAEIFHQGSINFNFCPNPEAEIEKLLIIPGIGKWTAHYIAMRSLGWTDAFLDTDVGIKKALSNYSKEEITEMAEKWRPWRSYANINLWNSIYSNE